MKLAPNMIQSMEILQMSQADLEERIEQELENNATLEIAEPGSEAAGAEEDGMVRETEDAGPREDAPMRVDEGSATADFERLGTFEESNPGIAENQYEGADARSDSDNDWTDRTHSRQNGDGDGDAKSEAMANTAARSATLTEQLLEQWGLTEVEEALRPLGALLITYIEDDGYLRASLESIAEKATPGAGWTDPRPTVEQLERALKAVQLLMEPAGIGARDTKECLLLQLDALEEEEVDAEQTDWALLRTLVQDHLDDLAQNRLPKVAQKTGITIDQLKHSIEKLRMLSLAPGRKLIQKSEPGLVPDAIVEFDADNDRYYAYLNDRRLPNLRVNQEYAKLAKDRAAPKPTRDFIKVNLANAQFLMEAIEQRRRTLLRVVEAVVAAQREYFDFGPQALRPLPMTKVAEQMGVHVATVSRAVAEKYLQTPRGVVPLRKFFSGGTTTDEGEQMSWDAIKAALLDIIEKEDKKDPLSDDALADELKKRGIEIARRTVAKYRGQLNIPTGRLRKAH